MAEGGDTDKDEMFDEVNKNLFRVLDINHKLEQTINTLFAEKETFRSKISERNKLLKERLDMLEQKMLDSLDAVCNGQLESIKRKRNKCLDLANHTKTTVDRLKAEKDSSSCVGELQNINRILERDLKYLGEGEERVSLYLMINDDLEQYVSETASVGGGPSQTNIANVSETSSVGGGPSQTNIANVSETSSVGGGPSQTNIATGSIENHNETTSSVSTDSQTELSIIQAQNIKDNHGARDFLPSTPEPPSYFDVVMSTFPFPHGSTYNSSKEGIASDSLTANQNVSSSTTVTVFHESSPLVDVNDSAPPQSARLISSFKTKTPSDKKNSRITGAAFLENGSIALADRNNKKVKLFTESFDLMAECKLEEYPFDVCQTCTGNIATSVTKMERVLFFDCNLENLLEELDIHQPCLGITAKHGKLYVCCDGTWTDLGCIKVFDIKNQLLLKIEKDIGGKILMSNTKYIDVCPKNGNIYFTKGGFGKSTLYCISCPVTVAWKSKLPSVSHYYGSGVPFGIAAINDGVLLAMSFVKCVTENGNKWESFVDPDERFRINAICVNKEQTLMLVSQADPTSECNENNLIRIFRLEYKSN